jgi:hypothetical protein
VARIVCLAPSLLLCSSRLLSHCVSPRCSLTLSRTVSLTVARIVCLPNLLQCLAHCVSHRLTYCVSHCVAQHVSSAAAYPFVNLMPQAAFVGMMWVIVYYTFEWKSLPIVWHALTGLQRREDKAMLLKIKRVDVLVILVTTVVTAFTNLAVGVACGLIVNLTSFAWDSVRDAESSLGDAKSSLGDAKSSLGDAKSCCWVT